MNEAPGHLYTRQEDIARMEALVSQLPDEAVVELHLTDGGAITGVVTTRPSVQVFRDGDGHEGFNAVVRIDDHRRPDVTHYLWLDRIASVTPLGSACCRSCRPPSSPDPTTVKPSPWWWTIRPATSAASRTATSAAARSKCG